MLVVTELDDPTADRVIMELGHRGVPIVRLDPGDFPCEVRFSALAGDGQAWHGDLHTPTRHTSLGIRSLYYRRPRPYAFPELNVQDARFAAAQARQGLGGVLGCLPGCLYVNHPLRIRAAEVKPAQLDAAIRLGFTVPPTLVTNDPAAARTFAKTHAPVVHKPLSAPSYQVDGEPRTIWVEEIDPSEIDDEVAGTAHLFQARVDWVCFVRVTVIDERAFCIRIDGEQLDWRRDYGALSYSVVQPPAGLVRRLHGFMTRFGLAFGTFDFACDRNGDWVFLECNPNGQWDWLEVETGMPMTAALADLLERGLP